MYLCWFQKLDKAPRKEGFILKFLFFQSSLYPGLAYSEEYRGKCSFGTYPNLDGPDLRVHLVEPPGFPCAGRDKVRQGFNKIYLWAPILLIFINSWKATSENINEDMSHVLPHINKTSLVLNSYYSRAMKGRTCPTRKSSRGPSSQRPSPGHTPAATLLANIWSYASLKKNLFWKMCITILHIYKCNPERHPAWVIKKRDWKFKSFWN